MKAAKERATDEKAKSFARRIVLKSIAAGLLGAFSYSLASTARARMTYLKCVCSLRTLPLDLPQGASFHRDLIAVRRGEDYLIFSARCSHLGCLIDNIQGNELVCPCHGSRYDLTGQVIAGPAIDNLQPRDFHLDHNAGKIIVFAE